MIMAHPTKKGQIVCPHHGSHEVGKGLEKKIKKDVRDGWQGTSRFAKKLNAKETTRWQESRGGQGDVAYSLSVLAAVLLPFCNKTAAERSGNQKR